MRRFAHHFIALGLIIVGTPAFAVGTVVIDAGHGGHDRGGGPGQRIPEKPYTLDIAQRLSSALRARGFKTVMTRSDDTFISLGQRCAVGNSQRNGIFVSIHLNSARREGADGIETYYYSAKSASLASALHSAVVRAAGTEDRHVRRRGFYVIRRTTRIPAVLVECGFLTNRAEAKRLLTASHRQKLANAIAAAIAAKY
jgi:N-acetylmuramoyl-L-alanine amidase